MSRDYQLAWACPHLTVEEVVSLDSDRMSLFTKQPVASTTLIRILANDEVLVPQGGLFTAGQLFSTGSGPFDVIENEDTLTIETSAGTQSVKFDAVGIMRLETTEVVRRLLENKLTVALVENINGHIVFTDTTSVGETSFVKVSGSAAHSLGFGDPTKDSLQRADRGRMLFPAWVLHKREDTITNRYPKFREPVKQSPVFKVTYPVPPERCLRCGGSIIENDVRFASSGQAILVENEDLLYQATLKILLTERGSNPYHSWYGTTIKSRIGSKAVGNISALLSEDVRRSLQKFQDAQQSQAKFQRVSLRERLYSVQSVRVQEHPQDPMTYLIDVVVRNASGEPVNLSVIFTVPEVISVLGAGTLALGTAPKALPTPTELAGMFLNDKKV